MESAASINDFKPFQNISETNKILLVRRVLYSYFTKTMLMLQKGQRVSNVYVVVHGQLRVFSLTPDGNEATLYLISPGEPCALALNCIFNDLPYPAWIEASPASKIAVIPGAVFKILFESEPAIRDLTIQAFSTIVFKLTMELEEIHSYKLEHRLVNFLLLHASTDGKIRMTQLEIASHLGTSREVIARVLSQVAAKGHILTSRNQITINDPASLAKFVNNSEPKLKRLSS